VEQRLTDLASDLWRIRELLELLLFKLEEEQVLLAAGRTRWVPHATREVELVLEQIRNAEQIRAAHTRLVAHALGLPDDVSMVTLANRAPSPWGDLLHQHRRAFLELTAEITALAKANRDLASTGGRAVREALLMVTGTTRTYGSRGEAVSGERRARLVDEAI
jgi:FlgN protein